MDMDMEMWKVLTAFWYYRSELWLAGFTWWYQRFATTWEDLCANIELYGGL